MELVDVGHMLEIDVLPARHDVASANPNLPPEVRVRRIFADGDEAIQQSRREISEGVYERIADAALHLVLTEDSTQFEGILLDLAH